MRNAVATFLATSGYYRCLLVVHPEIRRLEAAANELVSAYGWPRLSVGGEVSAVLRVVPPARYPRAASRCIDANVGQMAPGPVLCTEIDVLFEPALKLDPLALLRQTSRQTALVVTWPGSYVDELLAYAAPEHGHYRAWHRPGILVVRLE